MGWTLHVFILPYLEQQALYDQAVLRKDWPFIVDDPASGGDWDFTVVGQVLPVYLCLSDPVFDVLGGKGVPIGAGQNWAVTNYGANFLVFGDPENNSFEGSAKIPNSIPDGTSNTLFFGERYSGCGTCPDGSNVCLSPLWADTGAGRPLCARRPPTIPTSHACCFRMACSGTAAAIAIGDKPCTAAL
jgi:hypothetical protein